MICEHLNSFTKKNKFYDFLENESKQDYFKLILEKVNNSSKNNVIWPKKSDWFRALTFFEPNETRLIIIGQDPYHNPNQADGLAFSTRLKKCPKSLANIIKEVKKDYPNSIFETYSLDFWAKQGVLLINTVLTVEEFKANSHNDIGWQQFVFKLIEFIANINQNVIFGLWGKQSYQFIKPLIESGKISENQIIYTSHPSPLSYTRTNQSFKDSNFFRKVNSKLTKSIDFSMRKEK
ncbi:uracil-DNA glycosylase [Mycoplasmopsis bovigenitalium]|uniref:Uracil-DNA glycosylase n=1 Tax=Mycoplasmopsis bovigenitalium TaxID=2112 RepID=A0A449A948_9BACT|nr:uracil-DNA glycosylase [Mycoplasmopsis bovigenitalium]VEU60706.1 uracil-DNA glycosylase [Mycoplasmopsis bovigenitalium]